MTEQKLPPGIWVYKNMRGKYGQEFDPAYCAASVAFGGRRVDSHQCTRKWKVEKRGHRWCGQHDPDKVEERQKKAHAKYEAKVNARMAPDRRIEKLEAINADLLEALKALLKGRPTEEPPIGIIPKEKSIAYKNWLLFEQGRKAIRKAEKHREQKRNT